MSRDEFREHYNKQSETYESLNSFKKDIARQVISSAPALTSAAIVLDNACGPGIVTEQLLEHFKLHSSPKIFATDFSTGMISVLQSKIDERAWKDVNASVMDAEALEYPDETFTHSFTNFGIFLFPNPEQGAKEIFRTLKQDGVALVAAWYRLEWHERLQALQRRVNPDVPIWEGPFAGWMGTARLRETMLAGGFEGEKLEIMMIPTTLASDVRDRYLGAMLPTWCNRITNGWCEEKVREFQEALDEERDSYQRENRKILLETAVAIARK